MNPIFVSVVSSVLQLKLTCPRYKRDQIVPANKRSKSVRCKFCGADVPPRN